MIIFFIVIIVLIFVYWQSYGVSNCIEEIKYKSKGHKYNYFNIYNGIVIRGIDAAGNTKDGINIFSYYDKDGYDIRGFNKEGYDEYGDHITRIST